MEPKRVISRKMPDSTAADMGGFSAVEHPRPMLVSGQAFLGRSNGILPMAGERPSMGRARSRENNTESGIPSRSISKFESTAPEARLRTSGGEIVFRLRWYSWLFKSGCRYLFGHGDGRCRFEASTGTVGRGPTSPAYAMTGGGSDADVLKLNNRPFWSTYNLVKPE